MKAHIFTALIALCVTCVAAQSPDASPAAPTPVPVRVAQTHSSDIGFSYSLPLDWEIMDTKPMLPVVREQVTKDATSEGEKKGIACAQIALLARYGDPHSVIEALVIPFDCLGQHFSDKDLASLASGMSTGLKKTFNITDPVYGAYTLGTHSVWIERATGSFISHPGTTRTLEIACTILKKGVVCWMAIAADVGALQTFEYGAVTLEGEELPALVPETALQKKP
jgi:hypothetical protein